MVDYVYRMKERLILMTIEKETITLKEKAVSFLQLVASGKIREAYTKYVGTDFRHHNPYFRGDADSLMRAMEEDAAQNTGKLLEVKLTIQEGDTVMVYSHMRRNQEDLGFALVHTFRFHENKIVEMWDIGQPVPENSPNEYGMF